MKRPKIVYIYDALCGWCYGFSDVLSELYDNYKDTIDFDVLSGGLFVGERVGPINQVAGYIKKGAYKRVEETTGVMFGKAFIEGLDKEPEMIMESIWPAVALCIVKEEQPNKVFEFASILKKAFYHDNLNPVDSVGYGPLAAKIGLDADDFNKKMGEQQYKELAVQEFEAYRGMGINGFPALVLDLEGQMMLLAQGYTPYDAIIERLQSVKAI